MTEQKKTRTPAKVIGPIRCHTCQQLCRDAEHYLSHRCEPKSENVRS